MKSYRPIHGDTIYFYDFTHFETIGQHLVEMYDKMYMFECTGKETCQFCSIAKSLMQSDKDDDHKRAMKLWVKNKYKFQIFKDIDNPIETMQDYLMSKSVFSAMSLIITDHHVGEYLCEDKPLALRFFITEKHGYPCYDYSCFLIGNNQYRIPIGYLHKLESSHTRFYSGINLQHAAEYLSSGGPIFNKEYSNIS
jgi:hypothetical protein